MGKGGTPKEEMTCESNLGHTVKSCMTVIRFADGVLSIVSSRILSPALCVGFFYQTHLGGKYYGYF